MHSTVYSRSISWCECSTTWHRIIDPTCPNSTCSLNQPTLISPIRRPSTTRLPALLQLIDTLSGLAGQPCRENLSHIKKTGSGTPGRGSRELNRSQENDGRNEDRIGVRTFDSQSRGIRAGHYKCEKPIKNNFNLAIDFEDCTQRADAKDLAR